MIATTLGEMWALDPCLCVQFMVFCPLGYITAWRLLAIVLDWIFPIDAE